jgi:hypothetical protein
MHKNVILGHPVHEHFTNACTACAACSAEQAEQQHCRTPPAAPAQRGRRRSDSESRRGGPGGRARATASGLDLWPIGCAGEWPQPEIHRVGLEFAS